MEEQKTEEQKTEGQKGQKQEGQEQEGKVTGEKKQQVNGSVQIDNLTLHGVFFYMVLNDWGQYAQWPAAPGTRTGNANGMVLGVKYRITASGNDLQGKPFAVQKDFVAANPALLTFFEDGSGVHWK